MPKHKHFEEHDELASVFSEQPNLEPPKILPIPEQKVNDILLDVFDISIAPQDGTNIVVMESKDAVGVMAYWRWTRIRSGGKWTARGRWSETLTHMPIAFTAKYWKDADMMDHGIDSSINDKARIAELENKLAELSRGR